MKGNSTLRSDSLLIKIAVPLLKPILRILVWIARDREKTNPDAGQEQLTLPAYGQRFFHFLVFGDELIALLEDQQEHYQKIFTKNGKDAADQWFYKELPETLSLLILGSRPWVYAIHSMRRRFSHLLSLRHLNKQLSSLLSIMPVPPVRLKLSTACGGLLVLIVTAALLAPVSNQLPVDVAEDRSNESSTRRQENPSSNRNEVSETEPLVRSPKAEQDNPPVKPATADKPPPKLEPATQLVTLRFPPITRELVSIQVVRVLPKRTMFSISLPWGNERGPYKIKVADDPLKTLVSHRVNVRNGHFAVVLDFRRLKPGRYWLTVSNEVESHACRLEILRTSNYGR